MVTGHPARHAPTSAAGVAAAVERILATLDAEQRAAATLPDGPAQIIAPAGSGKTTTMVARLAVLLSRGVPPEGICVVTFNRDAAADLAERVARRLGPHLPDATRIEIRTLHALSLRILQDAGDRRELVADRLPLLRAARRRVAHDASADAVPDPTTLDGWLSAATIEGRPIPDAGRAALDAYRDLLAARGAIDFDDLVVLAGQHLRDDDRLRARWQARFRHVCVDEFQDVDAAQLRLVELLAAPEDNLFVVGDDDQTIYAWRLADVRRILAFGDRHPGARRVMLATNYRCPRAIVERSAELIAVNRERFVKLIRPPPASPHTDAIGAAATDLPDSPDRLAALLRAEAAAGHTACVLARTRSELLPVMLALVRAGIPHRFPVPPVVESTSVLALLDAVRVSAPADGRHPFHALRAARAALGWDRRQPSGDLLADEEHVALDAVLGWTAAFRVLPAFLAAFDAMRARLAALRDPTSLVELATAHGAKGREWQTVVVIGFEAGRMPNARSLVDADDRDRAFEEERRLAYVALTRATRRLVLAFDPARPSPFLADMGLGAR
jgi:DNA helicase-2/ATP-dependent DNA helicase PcrA